ncbi:hypothetical protein METBISCDRAFT_25356 [Metschnikowia bicuspidata]|uniref:Increased recombination centers protein 6 n=1 Tax=Metschnikowia bicuspidata TaxID=27322 RepID=A0A4P9ZIE6_9ASCO|nr:hypothetical protein METBISCDRAFT_25356 [Metschnikowia bicuspidata]
MGNNVLIVGPPKTGKLSIAQLLSGDLDCSTVSSKSHSGLVYQHTIETKYFKAMINLLIEEYPETRDVSPTEQNLAAFVDEIGKPEYQDLRDDLDGILFTIDLNTAADTQRLRLKQFERIRALFGDQELFYAVVGNAQKLAAKTVERLEDEIMQSGFEFVDTNASGINEFREKLGPDRLVEILESHEWTDIDSGPAAASLLPEDVARMAESLLAEGQVSFDELLVKIRAERERVKNFDPEEKERAVRDIVEDLMEHM